MSKLEVIESEIRELSMPQVTALRDWLDDYLEDQAQLAPEFLDSIERGQADLLAAQVRVHQP